MKRFLLPFVLSALTLAAPGTSAAADGKALYSTTCVSCHGANGKGAFPGVADLGPRMAKTDAELSNSILNGFQTKGSPMAMPAKGGNPALTAADADALVVYLRTQLFATAAAALEPSVAKPPAAAVAAQEPTPVPPPTTPDAPAPAQAPGPPSDMAAFARGAKAWGEHCASCHAMRDPKDFNDAQWKIITTHMRLRAGLDGADVRDINIFLTGSN